MPPNPLHHRHGHHHDYHSCHQASFNPSCCCSCCHCNTSASPPPPPPISIDHLLQYMTAEFVKIQPFLKPQQTHSQTTHHLQPLLHSLIRRVSAVESSLSQLSSQSSTKNSPPPISSCRPQDIPPPHPPSTPLPAPSLRDVAARTIQARFRRFLVRRSQNLRDLKRLASVKSRAASLRSLISGNTNEEPDALSQKAMDLLLQLDSIQSSDPMIRDGKRSISRELTSMLDFVEKVLVKERQLSLQAMDVQEDTSLLLPPHARSAKRVSFVGNGGRTEEGAKDARVMEEEVYGYGNGKIFHDQDDGFGLSAPLPLQMEPRLGL